MTEAGTQRDETALLRTALSALRGFAQEQQKRLLLISVENVHMIFSEQIGSKSDALQQIVDEDPTFMMLATSIRDASGERDEDRQISFARNYQVINLQPLELTECQKLWETRRTKT